MTGVHARIIVCIALCPRRRITGSNSNSSVIAAIQRYFEVGIWNNFRCPATRSKDGRLSSCTLHVFSHDIIFVCSPSQLRFYTSINSEIMDSQIKAIRQSQQEKFKQVLNQIRHIESLNNFIYFSKWQQSGYRVHAVRWPGSEFIAELNSIAFDWRTMHEWFCWNATWVKWNEVHGNESAINVLLRATIRFVLCRPILHIIEVFAQWIVIEGHRIVLLNYISSQRSGMKTFFKWRPFKIVLLIVLKRS